jgi:hypothetical protein
LIDTPAVTVTVALAGAMDESMRGKDPPSWAVQVDPPADPDVARAGPFSRAVLLMRECSP